MPKIREPYRHGGRSESSTEPLGLPDKITKSQRDYINILASKLHYTENTLLVKASEICNKRFAFKDISELSKVEASRVIGQFIEWVNEGL